MVLPFLITQACHRRPMVTGVAAAAIKGGCADLLSQSLFQEGDYKPLRTAAFALWNASYCGFGVFRMYSVLLPQMWPVRLASGAPHPLAVRHTALCVVFDNFFATPFLCLPTYYLLHGWLESIVEERLRPHAAEGGGTPKPVATVVADSLRRYAAEARETLQLSWTLWIPIHTVTFTLVPVPLRTHWTAAMSFLTLTAMSVLQCSLEARRDTMHGQSGMRQGASCNHRLSEH